MKKISRRQFLYVSALLSFSYPSSVALTIESKLEKDDKWSKTIHVLKDAYVSEMIASKHYSGFCRKADKEKYPNIAYLFLAFSISEKTHADNYRRILTALSTEIAEPDIEALVLDTKSNLRKAAKNELIKIEKTYPDYLLRLGAESHDQAVINCMYSWKSHCQHEEKINEVRRYSKLFFNSVAREIEGMKLDFHVCDICGSTVDEAPNAPCGICNYPVSHYQKVKRPI